MTGSANEILFNANRLDQLFLGKASTNQQDTRANYINQRFWGNIFSLVGIALAAFVSILFYLRITRPIEHITQIFQELAEGRRVEAIDESHRRDEIGKLASAASVFKAKNEQTTQLLVETERMCVLRPLKVILTNYDESKTEQLTAPGHPNRDDLPARVLPFGHEVYIDAEDFREEANKKYKRLVLGKRVRLRNAYVIEADEAVKNDAGEIIAVKARVIENTIGQDPEDGVKPKGVIQWVAAHDCAEFTVNLYDRLFTDPAPDAGGKDFLRCLNPDSLVVLPNCKGEKGLVNAEPGKGYQFEREGYFCRDLQTDTLVFNRTIGLRDGGFKSGD